MDVSTLAGAAPTAIPIGILLTIMGWLWKMLAQSEKRNGEYIDRINEDYNRDLQELRDEIKELKSQIHSLTQKLDEERELRRQAQEEAHRTRLGYDQT